MTIKEILNITKHRPWELNSANWKYYQEWNNAIFLHWEVDLIKLQKLVPEELEIDLFDGKPWVSLVAFTMEKIRPKNLPAFSPISDFHEINIRTYVRKGNKTGVYFLSIEGGTLVSCKIAKALSELPYRYSKIKRTENFYNSGNRRLNDKMLVEYKVGHSLNEKTELDYWLTERYALFQDTKTSINEFEIHHVEWPAYELDIREIEVEYPRFNDLIKGKPHQKHYSTGVQVIAWSKKMTKKLKQFK